MNNTTLAKTIRQKLANGEARMPVLPESVLKVKAIIQDERKGADDIARVIGSEPTFSTAVLRLANSARFRTTNHEIRSLPMAIQRLGGSKTLQLLIAVSAKLYLTVKDRSMQQLIRRSSRYSLLVATAAQHLARMVRSADPEEAFLAGMLFDVGIPAMLCAVPEEFKACSDEDKMELLKLLHREMGGRLMHQWDMPDVFASVAAHHGIEADDRPREKLIDYVDAACFLLQMAGHPAPFDDIPEGIEPLHHPPMKRLGITETHLAAVEVELEDGLAELESIFDSGS